MRENPQIEEREGVLAGVCRTTHFFLSVHVIVLYALARLFNDYHVAFVYNKHPTFLYVARTG